MWVGVGVKIWLWYFGPTTFSFLQYFHPAILLAYCNIGSVYSILLIRPTDELQILSVCSWHCYHKYRCSIAHKFVGHMHILFRKDFHKFNRSDAQLFVHRLDAQQDSTKVPGLVKGSEDKTNCDWIDLKSRGSLVYPSKDLLKEVEK